MSDRAQFNFFYGFVCFHLSLLAFYTSHCGFFLSHSWIGLKLFDSRSWIWLVFDKAHFGFSNETTVWRNLSITNCRASLRHTPHSFPLTEPVIQTGNEHEQNAMFLWKQTALCAHYLSLISLSVCLCLRLCLPSFIAACLPDSPF